MLNFTVHPDNTYWEYWYTFRDSYLTRWEAPSFVAGLDIPVDKPIRFYADGLMAGKNNSSSDVIGEYSNPAGMIFSGPNRIGQPDIVELNLPNGQKLGSLASYGATLIGNPTLGWKPIFLLTEKEGLERPTTSSVVRIVNSLNDLFETSIPNGTKLFVTYNDIDNGNPGAYNISISGYAVPDPVRFEVNGHYYQAVEENVTWDEAFTRANSASFRGLEGYLATITSPEEDRFVHERVVNQSDITGWGSFVGYQGTWLGGSDRDGEGLWRWMNGPEKGELFAFSSSPFNVASARSSYSNFLGIISLPGMPPRS
jgi:hypothetical protein